MCDTINDVARIINEVESFVEELIVNVNVDSELLPCLKAHILNSITLPVAFEMCRGRKIDIVKVALKVKKYLHRRIKVLTRICHIYKKLLLENSRDLNVVVDLGCGLGVNLNIARFYADKSLLIGIDRDLCLLKVLKRLHSEVEAVLADISMLPLRDNIVDVTFCTVVLHELPDLRLVSEIVRTLKSSGLVLIIDVVLRFIPSKLLSFIRSLGSKIGFDIEIPYALKQIRSAIESHGMRITAVNVDWKLVIAGIATFTAVKEIDDKNGLSNYNK